jgi:hypothetical protein
MSLSNQTGNLVGPALAGLLVGGLSFPILLILSA